MYSAFIRVKPAQRQFTLSHLLIDMGTEQLNSCVNTYCFIQWLAQGWKLKLARSPEAS